ncbi:MAG: hypothetical protein JO253_09655, partial [Alphaproteobacteria bacterium]|nr:hypothetical protein [Alphaproteobacteria bacterium]
MIRSALSTGTRWLRDTAALTGQTLSRIFTPPFDGLGLFCVLFLLWAYLVAPQSFILRGEFIDPDDYMYLDQMLDLLKGQSWFDNVQHRLDPPNGVMIHFSHVTMIPMMLITMFFHLLGFGYRGAATLMAIIYPSFLFGGLLAALRWMASRYIPKDWAGASAYIALSATTLIFALQPGHIHHHGTIVVIVAWALACALRLFDEPERKLWPLLVGGLLALGMTVALEVLPWILLISAWIGLWATTKGGVATRAGLLYSLTLFLGSVAGLLANRGPEHLFTIDLLMYSVVYVILTGGIAITFCGVHLFSNAKAPWRWIAGGLFAGTTGALFLHQFPDLIAGPYGGVSPEVRAIILDNVIEAQPMKSDGTNWLEVSFFVLNAMIALVVSAFLLVKSDKKDRWGLGLHFVMQGAVLALCLFYQRRFAGMCGMLAVVPLTIALYRGWQWVGRNVKGRKRFWAELGLILGVGIGTTVLFPALMDG